MSKGSAARSPSLQLVSPLSPHGLLKMEVSPFDKVQLIKLSSPARTLWLTRLQCLPEIKFHPGFASSLRDISRDGSSHETQTDFQHVTWHTVGVQRVFSKYSARHTVCVCLDSRASFIIRAVSFLILQTVLHSWFILSFDSLPAFCCEHPLRRKLDSYLLPCTKSTPNGSRTPV